MSYGGFITAIGLAEDLKKGLIDRSARCRWRARRCSRAAPPRTSRSTSFASKLNPTIRPTATMIAIDSMDERGLVARAIAVFAPLAVSRYRKATNR